MNLRLLPFFFFLSYGLLYAQEEPRPQIDSLKKTQIQIVDSLSGKKTSGDLPSSVVATRMKDTMVFALEDMALA